MKAVIIAGGLGTRLRPLTYNTPKPIVPVANRPFIAHQIEHLKQHGVTEVILNLHYLPDMIKKVIGDGSKFGLKVRYSLEKDPLGTAGAVKNAEEFFDDGPLVVFNGDILTDINITKIVALHLRNKAKATLTLTPVEDPTAYGLVLTEENGRVTEFLEKPSWTRLEKVDKYEINAGIYVLDPSIFKSIKKGVPCMFEHDVFPKLLSDGEPVYACSSDRYWIDIGNSLKYKLAHEAILRNEVAVRVIGTRNPGGYWVDESADIHHSAKLFGPVMVGEKAKVREGALVKDYTVLGEKVDAGEEAVLEHCIVWKGSRIGRRAKLNNCIIGNNCRIEDDCAIKGAVIADNSVIARGSVFNV